MITRQLIFNPFFRYKCGCRFRKSGKKVVLRKIKKHRICNDHSYFSCLPDEIVVLILNKLVDLKTLCRCKLVSKQFNLIVHQVDTISFVASRADNPSCDPYDADEFPKKLLDFLSDPFHFFDPLKHPVPVASYQCESFRSAFESMSKFTRLKSLCIELPSTRQDDVDNGSDLYKWKLKFGRKMESFVFLSPDSVCDMKGLSNVDGNGQDEEQYGTGITVKKHLLAIHCLMDATVRFFMLLGCTFDFPLLEKVLIMQSCKRGSVSISGEDIAEMRKWLHSPTDSLEQKLGVSMVFPTRRCQCYVPLLKLPVSGYLMKGVTLFMFQMEDLIDGDDNFIKINLDEFEDKEEAAYGEAMMEMLKKLRSQR